MVSNHTKENLRSIYDEFFGERTDHPLLARILAFLADYILFLASGPVIFFGLESIDRSSAANQLLVDLVIWTPYFTLGNSRIFHGQTIGKKLLRIRVVDNEGRYLAPAKSFVRSVPLVLSMTSYQIMFLMIAQEPPLNILKLSPLAVIVFGTFVLPFLNLSRQGLHDLLVSSQVIPRDRLITIEKKSGLGLVWSLIIIIGAYFTFGLN
jgi:uncharacterized RDD family membrane protein YckC